ncbi:glycosyltransferase [Alteromonas marina]|uniref:glycosyltransferase n=1 Tax=Alteromonas sp. OM2203 TaxID=3398817 RepID=UPI003AF3CE32
MNIFTQYLPWTRKRIETVSSTIWEQLFSPAKGIIQDQSQPISNLMVLVGQKLAQNTDLSTFKKRAELVSWYNEYGRSIFNIDELEQIFAYATRAKPANDKELIIESGGVNLVGYNRGRLGLGEDIRGYAALLDDMGCPYSIVHVGHPSDDPSAFTHPNEGIVRYNKSIFFLNAIEIANLLAIYDDFSKHFGRAVAVPPWELENVSEEWISTLESFEEVWGISAFTTTALQKVHSNVHYAAPVVLPLSEIDKVDRKANETFRFLFIFDAGSFIERKNPLAIIEAFQQAFHSSENVELVLKVANESDGEHWTTVKQKAYSDRRIKIISRLMNTAELDALWLTADCYISLHRSEGFGRTIAEALLRKLPVITTNYSGSTDLFPEGYPWLVDYELIPVEESAYPFACNSRWANASIEDTVKKMRHVRALKNEGHLQDIINNAKDFVTKQFIFDNDSRPITRWLKCEKE